jgi:hypothetical protein
MHDDKEYTGRGIEESQLATAMPADEFPSKVPPPPTSRDVPPNPEGAATSTWQRFTAEDKLRILKLADTYTTVGSLGTQFLAK